MLLYDTSALYLFLPSDSPDAEGLQCFKSSHGMKKCTSKKKKAASTENYSEVTISHFGVEFKM